MENISISPTQSRHNLICPITLDVFRDPVLAGDGHVYEREAIIQWIEQQGTSPLTRQPVNINDLSSAENIKQLCRSNPVIYSSSTNMVTLPSTPMSKSKTDDERRITCKQNCNIKRTLLIILGIGVLVSPFVLATSIIFYLRRSSSMPATVSTDIKYPSNFTNPSTTYNLPNNCTLSHIIPLFSWNNVHNFNYTYYSKSYMAVSTRTIITFAFRSDPSYWCLDNVSVIDISSNIELVTNGGFEDNPSDGFIRCNSYGNSSTTLFLSSAHPYSGKRSFCDGSVGLPDYLSQTLNTKIGQIYRVSFWLENKGNPPNSAQVMMSY